MLTMWEQIIWQPPASIFFCLAVTLTQGGWWCDIITSWSLSLSLSLSLSSPRSVADDISHRIRDISICSVLTLCDKYN